MARTVTLRLSDAAYAALKQHAQADDTSMNTWLERLLDAEDMRRRCTAHAAWLARNPVAADRSEAWADRAFDDLPRPGVDHP